MTESIKDQETTIPQLLDQQVSYWAIDPWNLNENFGIPCTEGSGYNTEIAKAAPVGWLSLAMITSDVDPTWGVLCAHLSEDDWNPEEDGSPVSDPEWLLEFKLCLRSIGFSFFSTQDMEYADDEYQVDGEVRLYVSEYFIEEWLDMYPDSELKGSGESHICPDCQAKQPTEHITVVEEGT